MEVFSSIAIALNHSCYINFRELCLEIFQRQDSFCDALPSDSQGVLVRINVRNSAVVPDEMFASWSYPGVSQFSKVSFCVVRISRKKEIKLIELLLKQMLKILLIKIHKINEAVDIETK